MGDSDAVMRARKFFGGERLRFAEADALWQQLKDDDQLSFARRVLQRMREKPDCLSDGIPDDGPTFDKLCQQEALLTSKDPELSAVIRHDEALKLLGKGFRLNSPTLDGDQETLGIAGGICKRRWKDLGQLKDLIRAAEFYERGAKGEFKDGYAHINAAFLEDVLAEAGDHPVERRARATTLREQIVKDLPVTGTWWNAATRAEALFGLGSYQDATEALKQVDQRKRPPPWEFRTTIEQLAHLAYLRAKRPLSVPEIRTFFETLLPGADVTRSVIIGKIGLALSGGGFRASFYHLGVLACLAERDVLRDVEVLSCVSGGSIVGASYWLKLRQRMLKPELLKREDYVQLVCELIAQFRRAVDTNLRGHPGKTQIVWRLLKGEHGVLDPEKTATALDETFYRPLWTGSGTIRMHQLPFQPADHNPALAGPGAFNPTRHNWLRAHKVPALVLNATTVNTGHAWQFTPTWMGESPWAVHETADSIRRLEWAPYDPKVGWQIELGRAVAASACVPTVFAPLRLGNFYDDVEVTLVDGGVHDNQGTVSLLASDCNVILVSDACGQLMLESKPPTGATGILRSTQRSMDTLMERVRLASFADLDARRRSGLLRGLMFIHMKAGLAEEEIRLWFSQESYALHRAPLSPSGVRKDFQKALAELRTDLDAFTETESNALMACGYKMASKALDSDLSQFENLWERSPSGEWPFKELLEEITSVANTTAGRDARLTALRAGNTVAL